MLYYADVIYTKCSVTKVILALYWSQSSYRYSSRVSTLISPEDFSECVWVLLDNTEVIK